MHLWVRAVLFQIAYNHVRTIQMKRIHRPGFAGTIFLIPIFMLLASCQGSGQKYVLTGRVITKQPVTQQLVIDNDDIPGFMPAMTMPYAVKDADGFARVQPADIIRADVIMQPQGSVWLEHVVVTGKTVMKPAAPGAPARVLMIGEKAPDVPMINQDGKTIHFSQFAGKVVLFTFIYTRCPFPDYCPLLSSKFAEIQRDLSRVPDEGKKMHLISISLDPNFDKPPRPAQIRVALRAERSRRIRPMGFRLHDAGGPANTGHQFWALLFRSGRPDQSQHGIPSCSLPTEPGWQTCGRGTIGRPRKFLMSCAMRPRWSS